MTEAQKRAQAAFRAKRLANGFKQRIIWLSPSDDERLVKAAADSGLSVTEFIREKLVRVTDN
jgi:predicted HicB family RNase H-like nuclease